jgi:hypothetical protein
MGGWIKLHRKLTEHWIWDDKPFSKGQAWIDMLMMANHDTNKICIGNELIEVQRGSFITSELRLMDRWGWSKKKLRAFLTLLQEDGMIIKESNQKRTAIFIVNYEIYQEQGTTEEPQRNRLTDDDGKITSKKGTTEELPEIPQNKEETEVAEPQKNHEGTAEEPPRNHEGYTNKNNKNDKNIYIYSSSEQSSDEPKQTCSKGQQPKKREVPVFTEDTIQYQLALFMRQCILENLPAARVPDPAPATLKHWAYDIDKMIRLDSRSPDEIREMIDWTHKDNFWYANILSPGKLREKWDTLTAQKMRKSKTYPKSADNTVFDYEAAKKSKYGW